MPSRPEIYFDKSIGEVAVPAVFSRAGYVIHNKTEVFGTGRVADVDWIRVADDNRWAVVTKDDKIRMRPAEKIALFNSGLRVLCLPSGGLSSAEQAARFESNLARIERLWRIADRPWVYAVHPERLERLRVSRPD